MSPDTTESNYVLCERGILGTRRAHVSGLDRGATFADVPAPLSERHSISLEKEENCLQLVDYIASRTSLAKREGTIGKVAQQARLLAARQGTKLTIRRVCRPGPV